MTGDVVRISIPVGDEELFALEVGDPLAPLVLCLHGFPDHPPSFTPLAMELAARGYRVVAPWMRGYAPSPLTGPFDIETLVADVRGLLAALDSGAPRCLLGHDWGAVITYAMLGQGAPVASACAMSVPHPVAFARNALRSAAQRQRSRYILEFQSRGADRRVAANDFARIAALWRAWSPGLTLEPDAWESLRATLAESHPAPLEVYRALTRPPLRALARLRGWSAARIETPVLTVMGADDGCIGPELARGADRFFAGRYSLRVFAHAGHFIHVEHPQRLAEAIATHFDQTIV